MVSTVMGHYTSINKYYLIFRKSNPDIQKWMKDHSYTDYSKLEQYYETTYVTMALCLLAQVGFNFVHSVMCVFVCADY